MPNSAWLLDALARCASHTARHNANVRAHGKRIVAIGFVVAVLQSLGGCALDVPFSGESMTTAKDFTLRRQVIHQVRDQVKKRLPLCDKIDSIRARSLMYPGRGVSVHQFGALPFDPYKVPREEDEVWDVGACGQQLKLLVKFAVGRQGTTFMVWPIERQPRSREPVREPKDLILDFGDGDSIRLVGQASSFKCDDPVYGEVEKVKAFTLVFADGTTQEMCKPKSPPHRP